MNPIFSVNVNCPFSKCISRLLFLRWICTTRR